jgi:hypothetical protein
MKPLAAARGRPVDSARSLALELPEDSVLWAAPELAELALLAAALQVVAVSLRATYLPTSTPPHESAAAAAARDLIDACHQLRDAVLRFRDRTIADLRDLTDDDPFLEDPGDAHRDR